MKILCNSFPDHLNDIVDNLKVLSKNTEDEFLEIGRNLQDLSDGCTKNSSMATSLINVVEEGKGLNVDNLVKLFEKACKSTESCAEGILKGISEMTSLQGRLDEIYDLRSFLKSLSRSISIIGILTRIETSRLDGTEFSSMTEVVDDLARIITESTNQIALSADDANIKIKAISGKMGATIEVFNEELHGVQAGVRNILDEMDNMKKKAAWSCKRIEGRALQIIPRIGEIVTSLQYHDICRQQLEHVANALREIINKITAIKGAAQTEKVPSVRGITDLIRIQKSHLENVINETTNAAHNISANLTLISDLAEAQTEDANMILEEEESGSLKIENIINQLELLLDVTTKGKSMTTEMMQAVSEASSRIGTMSEHISNIVTISDNIGLLAINAIIKAARTGQAGRALEVLADRIRILSQEAKEEIEKGADKITFILSKSTEFNTALSEVLKEQLLSANDVGDELRSAALELVAADKSLIRSMTEISDLTNSLRADIAQLVSGMRFDFTIKSEVENIISELQDILDKIYRDGAELLENEPSSLSEESEDLTHLYTMQKEHDIHESTLIRERKSTYDSIVPVLTETSLKPKEEELGNNVELF